MSFPTVYREIREMVKDAALETPMARGIARKAGLRTPAGTPSRPRTIIDTHYDPALGAITWQWRVDLTNFTQLRLDAHGFAYVYGWYSLDLTSVLDPGSEAWTPLFMEYVEFPGIEDFLYTKATTEVVGAPLYWMALKDEHKAPMRISLSSSSDAYEMDPDLYGPPFGVSLQAV